MIGAVKVARTRSEQYPEIQRNILKRSAAVIARVGYATSTISDLAKAAEVSRGALYHYFPSKEAILCGILHQHLIDFISMVDEAMLASRVAVEQLRAVTSAIVEYNISCSDEQVVLLNDLNRLSASDRERMVGLERQILDRLSDLLIKIDNGGRIAPGNKRVYTMMYLSIVNYTFAWYNPKGQVRPPEYAELVTDLFLHGLLSEA
ncbi:MAG: TetR/AcrR family transcriptional regulator [Sterolibacterium sp.]|nr:TetR/AcrR family transcriptional regulator [Sterolibacterium sp.]